MSMPVQKPGRSKQDYCTPSELLTVIKQRLHIHNFDIDLAADVVNRVCEAYYSEEPDDDAFLTKHRWRNGDGWSWCNPPYANIEPWVQKATKEAQLGAQIVMLVPASVGANWWAEWVAPYAFTTFLNGRITFVGAEDPYPKDCALLLYTPWGFTGSDIWSWMRDVPKLQQPEVGKD